MTNYLGVLKKWQKGGNFMNKDKFKSIALGVGSYEKLLILSKYRFEMPVSMSKVVSFLIGKAYDAFEAARIQREAEESWALIKDWEPQLLHN